MNGNPYQLLARRLDALPNGYPSTADGTELRLLAKLFTPEDAALAARLRLTLETPAEIAGRTGGDPGALAAQLKAMARRGLIKAGRTADGLGYGLMPFVVGIYEMQINTIARPPAATEPITTKAQKHEGLKSFVSWCLRGKEDSRDQRKCRGVIL